MFFSFKRFCSVQCFFAGLWGRCLESSPGNLGWSSPSASPKMSQHVTAWILLFTDHGDEDLELGELILKVMLKIIVDISSSDDDDDDWRKRPRAKRVDFEGDAVCRAHILSPQRLPVLANHDLYVIVYFSFLASFIAMKCSSENLKP